MQRIIRQFLIIELCLSIVSIAIWGAIVSKGMSELLLFITFDTYEWTANHAESMRELRKYLGCTDEPVILCIRNYTERSTDALKEVEDGLSKGLPILNRFPFNHYGLVIAFIFLCLTLIIGIFTTQSKAREHNASSQSLLKKFPRISEYLNVAERICWPASVAASHHLHREPHTIRRQIYLPISFYQDYRANADIISPEQLHALQHERAHAVALFPFELLFKALHIACIVYFFIILIPFGIGIAIGPIAYCALAFTASQRRNLTESLADLLANKSAPNIREPYSKLAKIFWFSRGYLLLSATVGLFLLFLTSKSSLTGQYHFEIIILTTMLIVMHVTSIVLFRKIIH